MIWNEHLKQKGKHAILSPSKYHWLAYTDDKLIEFFNNRKAKERGTELHDLASRMINLKQKAYNKYPDSFSMFVNDAISFNMQSEQTLYYSDYVFGHCDAISFRKNVLRIHDYKSGLVPGSFVQLETYAALFCLEYKVDPFDIIIELRIYQFNDKKIHTPDPAIIKQYMEVIEHHSRQLYLVEMEESP